MLLPGAHWLLVKLLLCGVCVEYGMKVPLGIQRLPLSPMVPWAGRGGRFFSYLGRSHSWISLSSECNAASQVFRDSMWVRGREQRRGSVPVPITVAVVVAVPVAVLPTFTPSLILSVL